MTLRDELDALALAGASWSDLLRLVSRRAGVATRLLAVDGALLGQHGVAGEPSGDHELRSFDRIRPRLVDPAVVAAAHDAGRPVDLELADGSRWRALAVAAGDRRIGLLAVQPPTAQPPTAGHFPTRVLNPVRVPDPAQGAAPHSDGVEHSDEEMAGIDAVLGEAATAIAIVAVWRDAEASAIAETAGWFVDELRFGGRSDAELEAVGERFGVHLAAAHVAVQLTYDGDDRRMWTTALSWFDTPMQVEGGVAHTIVAVPAAERLAVIGARLTDVVSGGRVRVAAGPAAVGAAALRQSFRLVATIAALARQRHDQPTAVATYESIGAAALYLHVPTATLDDFVERHLGALAGRDDLLDTLRAWFATGGSRERVGRAVNVHRNSVGHRMARIAELLGIDPRAAEHAEALQAALLADEVATARRAVSERRVEP